MPTRLEARDPIREISEDYRWIFIALLAIVVGAVGGLGAVIFRGLIELVRTIFFSGLLSHAPSPYFVVLLPIIGGLIVGPIVYSIAPETRGDGIPAIMEAVHKRGGLIRKRVCLFVITAAAITAGSGGSAGREGPIAQIGASFGSAIGQILKLGGGEMRVLATCGVAAGIAGTFNAPMGGAIFSMEVISRRFSASDAVPVLLAAVVGNAVAASFIHPVPDFILPKFVFTTYDLAICFILGPLFGLLAGIWVRAYYVFEDLFSRLPIKNELKPAAGGIVAGISGLYLLDYGIMGVGYDGINHVFRTVTPDSSYGLVAFLLLLVAVKVLATSFTVGSGGSGGLFAPTLYLGSMLGAAFGITVYHALPGMVAAPAAYGLLGMGAFFAGAARAPLTCIVMIPEMASNYSRLPPLIISCILSAAVAQIVLKGGSMYTIRLMRRGIFVDVPEPVLESIPIGEIMQRQVTTVTPEMTVLDVRDAIAKYNYTGYPVVKDEDLVGMITFDDVRKVPPEGQGKTLVKDVAVKNVIFARPDQSVKLAMDIMYKNGIGRLPVVASDNSRRLLGIITRTDVIKAYEQKTKEMQPRELKEIEGEHKG